jgi:hypothetical protein
MIVQFYNNANNQADIRDRRDNRDRIPEPGGLRRIDPKIEPR